MITAGERCDWKYGVLLPAFKGKGDTVECGLYTAIKLLEHVMKVTGVKEESGSN